MLDGLLNSIFGGIASWKTTLTVVVGGILMLLATFGVIPPVTPHDKEVIIAAVMLILGWFAKDSDAVGKPLEDED